jgi:hypothetical protein
MPRTDEPARIIIKTSTGAELPPVLTVRHATALLGVHENTVMKGCRNGQLPTLRRHNDNAPWKIITMRLLTEHLGIDASA